MEAANTETKINITFTIGELAIIVAFLTVCCDVMEMPRAQSEQAMALVNKLAGTVKVHMVDPNSDAWPEAID